MKKDDVSDMTIPQDSLSIRERRADEQPPPSSKDNAHDQIVRGFVGPAKDEMQIRRGGPQYFAFIRR